MSNTDNAWKSTVVKATVSIAVLALAALAAYKLSQRSNDQPAEEVKTPTREEKMQEVMEQHRVAREEGKINDFYNSIDPAIYGEFCNFIKSDCTFRIAEAISQPEPKDGASADPNLQGFGYLNMRRDATIFDMGQGSGRMGKLLAPEGFTNIDGADASQNFVTTCNESGMYRKS